MNHIVRIFVLSIALFVARPGPPAVSAKPLDGCPKLVIACPDEVPREGRTYTVKLRVEGVDATRKLSYKWSVSSGEIVDGQGTATLKIRCTHPEESLTTTVEVGGLAGDCGNTASCSFSVS